VGFNKKIFQDELEEIGFRIIESKYTFGYWGSLAWEISMIMLKKKILSYLVLPIVYIFCLFDCLQKNSRGNGVLMVCQKLIS